MLSAKNKHVCNFNVALLSYRGVSARCKCAIWAKETFKLTRIELG